MNRGWKWWSATAAVLLVLMFISGMVAAAPAKNVTSKVSLEATCDNAAAKVKEVFTVVPGADVDKVPFEFTLFAGAKIENIKFIDAAGKELSFTSTVSQDGLRILYEVKPEAPLAGGKETNLTAEYVVANAVKSEKLAEIPVIYIPWAPKSAVPGTFIGKVTLAPGQYFVEGFPSIQGVETAGQNSVVNYYMKLVPSFIRLDTSPNPPGFFSRARKIEVTTIGIVVLSAAGWLYFTPLRKR